RVKNWRVVDDSTMVIDTVGHGELVATFMTPCRGIRYAEALGFATMGPFEIDKTTKVVLPDGRRCHFKELKPLLKLEEPGEGERWASAASQASVLADQVVGGLDFRGAFGRQLDHVLGDALAHQLVGMIFTHQLAIGFLDLGIAGVAGDTE